ncbi:amidohydrolase [Defluviimonas salinarum]|uniref:Amidohydrolase n=1 Tax=Defluviimonas salinarum TaxID=2992147 RepID=A0ABT3J4T6_9RHOB|nr:amidohydrolase [Defluviimonas salinarum]MCW3782685.1 amidohydrolase [Defluviimonas salinarum]
MRPSEARRLAALAAFCVASTSTVTSAQSSSAGAALVPEINQIVEADAARLQDIFKDIHQHAELGFRETRTAGIVAAELEALGFEVKTGIGITGVVGVMANGEGPTFAFRTDMDANAVQEATGLPYASTQRVTNLSGVETYVAHMCGHDPHTTWLIGLAKTMPELRGRWSGTLVLIAQPAEEPVKGAKAMRDDGLYETHAVPKPDYFLTFHTAPFSTGMVALTSGRKNTGTDHIAVTFHGSGGHGSSPHHATDPVIMDGMAIVQYQTIVSRMADPTETSVLTVGSVQAGVDNNVIPTEAELKLKLHYTTPELREVMVSGIERISNNIALSYGIEDEAMMPTIFEKGYAPVIFNDAEWMDHIRQVLTEAKAVDETVNERRVVEGVAIDDLQVPGSDDDFLLFEGLEDVKGDYIGVGTAAPEVFAKAHAEGKEFPFFVHEPNYVVDLDAIPWGTRLAAVIALDVLGKPTE